MKNDRQRTFLLITIPILALFFCFNTLPLIQGVIYSFTNFRGYGEFEWVGLRNYIDLFGDSRVGSSYLFTFKLAVVTTIVVNVLSLLYIYPSRGDPDDGWQGDQYAGKQQMGVGGHYDRVCMAGDRYEYHYLYLRLTDGSRGRL